MYMYVLYLYSTHNIERGVCTYMYSYVILCVYVYVYVYAYVYVYVYMCTCVYAYMYMYIYIYVCVHTHTKHEQCMVPFPGLPELLVVSRSPSCVPMVGASRGKLSTK